MKKSFNLLAQIAIISFISGCATTTEMKNLDNSSLIGTWGTIKYRHAHSVTNSESIAAFEHFSRFGQSQHVRSIARKITFFEDNTFTQIFYKDNKEYRTRDGTWKLEGNHLTLSIRSSQSTSKDEETYLKGKVISFSDSNFEFRSDLFDRKDDPWIFRRVSPDFTFEELNN